MNLQIAVWQVRSARLREPRLGLCHVVVLEDAHVHADVGMQQFLEPGSFPEPAGPAQLKRSIQNTNLSLHFYNIITFIF